MAEPFVLRPKEEADIAAVAAIEDASDLPERSLEARRNELGEERTRGVVLEVGERRRYYADGEDAVIMTLALGWDGAGGGGRGRAASDARR